MLSGTSQGGDERALEAHEESSQFELKCLADKIFRCLHEIEGYVPAASIIHPDYFEEKSRIRSSKNFFPIERTLSKIRSHPAYVRNISKNGIPFYWVHASQKGAFKQWYNGKKG